MTLTPQYDDSVFTFTDGAPQSNLPWWVPTVEPAKTPTRDVSNLTVGELVKRWSDQPHTRRQPVVIDGVARKETLREKLTREVSELDEAFVALAGQRAHRQKQLEQLARFPDEDPFKDGVILTFEKNFPSNPDQKYTFVAHRAAGLWYVTGKRSPQGVTWEHFVNWMGLGVDEIYKLGAKGRTKVIG